MIQRIQTIYLLLSLAVTALLFVLPVWTNGAAGGEVSIGSVGAGTHAILMLIWILMLLLQLITVFLFKNRKLQMTFCQLNMLLNVLFFLMSLVFIHEEKNLITDFSFSDFNIGALLPFASILFLFLANTRIRKDEELVKSMDRLR